MKKDLNWLKEEVKKALRDKVSDGINYYDYMDLKRSLNELIDQLDEPEVLSQEWIDENKAYFDNWMPAVPIIHLKNLLVSEQELPVIPKFVAEYIDFAKRNTLLIRVLELAITRNEWPKWKEEYDWISANVETFTRAWLDGYKIDVEEEQKYYVMNNENELLLSKNKDDEVITYSQYYPKVRKILSEVKEGDQFTEQEIKDYDPRYMTFAVKVEELEE